MIKKSSTNAIKSKQTIVSIITIVFNNSKYIKEAIESVLSQDYDSIEYIIIDGGSSDGTIEIISAYEDKISTFISEPDNGVYHAINKGISFATGDIVSILHSDDVYSNNNVVSRMVHEMINSCSEFCFSDMVIVNKDNGVVLRYYMASYFHRWMLRTGWMPPHPTCFIKKSLFYEFGMYSESYKVAGDFEFFVRIFYSREINWNYVNIISLKMRSGELSNSGFKSKLLTSREITKSLKQNKIWAPRYFQILRYLIRLIELISPKLKTLYRRYD